MRHRFRKSGPPVFAFLALALAAIMVPPEGGSGPAAAPAAGVAGKKDGPSDKPKLSLLADPAVGFTPLVTTITGQLTGIDRRDPNFCHAAITWIRIDPGQSEDGGFRVREDPACLHPPEETTVETSFTRTFHLSRPGATLVRLIVEGKDGTRIQSATTSIQVLRVQ